MEEEERSNSSRGDGAPPKRRGAAEKGEEEEHAESDSPSLSGSIGALGLSVDSVTLSGPLSYGLPLYDRHHKGRVVFSLRELEEGQVWYTENGNSVQRISSTHVLLGGSIELEIAEEEAFDAREGILTFDGEQLFLLESGQLSAEAEVERLTDMKFYQGIPLSSVEVDGREERGIVVFTLQQLPDDQPFYFERKSRLVITKKSDNQYLINGSAFQGAAVKQVLPADSSLLDLVFPHEFKAKGGSGDFTEEQDTLSDSDEIDDLPTDILKQMLAANEENLAMGEEEIAQDMLREFDERLKNVTLRRATERRRRLSAMMRQYVADPASPLRSFYSSSPLSSSSGTIRTRGAPTPAQSEGTEHAPEAESKGPSGLLLPPVERPEEGRTSSLSLPDTSKQEQLADGFEEVDLCTPRLPRSSNAGSGAAGEEPVSAPGTDQPDPSILGGEQKAVGEDAQDAHAGGRVHQPAG